jgi:hypothetical protein
MGQHGKHRALVIRAALLASAIGVMLAGPADAACRQALAVGLDVSASVDQLDYVLQAEGMARALVAPAVVEAFLAPGDPVALAVFEWSGTGYQRVIQPWVLVSEAAVLEAVAARVAGHRRMHWQGATAIGSAILYGGAMLAAGPVCDRATLDISGDGMTNAGPAPRAAHLAPDLAEVTINGLAITGDLPLDHAPLRGGVGALTRYYLDNVIKGPDAFVEVAMDFADFERAMQRKLVRELQDRLSRPAPFSAAPARRLAAAGE